MVGHDLVAVVDGIVFVGVHYVRTHDLGYPGIVWIAVLGGNVVNKVPLGNDPHEFIILGDHQSADVEVLQMGSCLGHRGVGLNRFDLTHHDAFDGWFFEMVIHHF